MGNLIDLDDENISDEINHKTEIKLNLENRTNPRVIIDVKRNENVAARAKQRSTYRKFESVAKNILIIFIDAVSRAHMYRTMPKTVKWLEKYYNNEDRNIESFQFFRFHSTDDFTIVNLKPLYYGTDDIIEQLYPLYPFHMRNVYLDQGYVVGGSHDLCSAEYYEYTSRDPTLIPVRNDHEGQSLFCDPSFTDPKAYYSMFKGVNTILRRCFMCLNSGTSSGRNTKTCRKYLNLMFVDAHEATGHGSRYLDIHLVNFLENLDELEDTAILLLSDHGQRLVSDFYSQSTNSDHFLEVLLPFLFFVFPKKALSHSQRTALKENENSLNF